MKGWRLANRDVASISGFMMDYVDRMEVLAAWDGYTALDEWVAHLFVF